MTSELWFLKISEPCLIWPFLICNRILRVTDFWKLLTFNIHTHVQKLKFLSTIFSNSKWIEKVFSGQYFKKTLWLSITLAEVLRNIGSNYRSIPPFYLLFNRQTYIIICFLYPYLSFEYFSIIIISLWNSRKVWIKDKTMCYIEVNCLKILVKLCSF